MTGDLGALGFWLMLGMIIAAGTLSEGLKARDKELDRSHKELIERLTRRMEEDPARLQDYLDLVFIARYLERAGDHAVNIGEDAVYAGAARDIRHLPTES